MAHTVDPQTQPASSDSVLSPDDYHWAERRGDTTGRSLIYAASVSLLILSASFSLSGPGHQWTTVTLATGFIIVIALGFTSKRRKARSSLPVSYHLVTTVIFLGCLFFLFYFDQDNLNSADGGPWQVIDGTVSRTSDPQLVRVWRTQVGLVAEDCATGADAWSCTSG